jgi:ABC-type bacteriocin/lantibiotic exporter with double-glycine peptidase domain
MLDIQNISFSYTENPVIKNISFSIEKGQNIAIIGESGCGKSTLLKLIYGTNLGAKVQSHSRDALYEISGTGF